MVTAELQILENPHARLDPKYPFIMTCTHPDCVTRLASHSVEHARAQWMSHLCPWFFGIYERLSELKNSRSLFVIMFARLDECINEFMEKDPEPTMERKCKLAGRIDAYAFCIHLWMQPIFADPTAVKHEGMKRYRSLLTGIPSSTPGVDFDWRPGTPGVGPSPAASANSVPVAALPAQTRSRAALVASIPDNKRAQVEKMWRSGNFDTGAIVRLTGLNENEVTAITSQEV